MCMVYNVISKSVNYRKIKSNVLFLLISHKNNFKFFSMFIQLLFEFCENFKLLIIEALGRQKNCLQKKKKY